MENLEDRGVSDVLTVVVMFIVLVMTSALIHGYANLGLNEAITRRNQIKANHFLETFGGADVRPYSISGLDSAAQHLVLEDPVVDNEYLHSWFDSIIEDFRPSGFGIRVVLVLDNKVWRHAYPDNEFGEEYISRGTISISQAGGTIETIDVKVSLFEIEQ